MYCKVFSSKLTGAILNSNPFLRPGPSVQSPDPGREGSGDVMSSLIAGGRRGKI